MLAAQTSPTPCLPWKLFQAHPVSPQPRELCVALSSSISRITTHGEVTQEQQEIQQISDWQSSEIVRCCLLAILRYLDLAREGVAPFWQNAQQLILLLLSDDTPGKLIACLDSLDFETRKDSMRVFCAVLRVGRGLGAEKQLVDYVRKHPRLLVLLLEGCGKEDVFTYCSQMLRSCMQYPALVEALYEQGAADKLVALARHPKFDMASEAFSSLRELLLAQKEVTATFLDSRFKTFFCGYNRLLNADDYVTQRQALKLLGEVLLDRSFMKIMFTYICDEQYLQIHMNLLRDKSRAIQLECFHVFKVFVANPHKPPRVQQILYRNKERLVKLLESFSAKKPLDAPVMRDLQSVLAVLHALDLSPRHTRSPTTTAPESEQGILVA